MAALASGRRFLGVDVDPTTLAIAAERLRQAIGTAKTRDEMANLPSPLSGDPPP